MLKQIGFNEIFMPKSFPNSCDFRSGSIDYSEDVNLSIPPSDLELLNQTDWYGNPSKEIWEIANRHFDILFKIITPATSLLNTCQNFQGAVLLRAYGLSRDESYFFWIDHFSQYTGINSINYLGRRFWFAQAYEHLHQIEHDYISRRSVFLPLGLVDCSISSQWQGNNKKIFFVCPDIALGTYYKNIYDNFIQDFSGIPYAIGGNQALSVNDPNVLGFLPREDFENNMRQLRVMFYHSSEPNHLHYHPIEAVQAGMPLIFMAGGVLDRFGGKDLPGRCKTIGEARRKIQRILNDDWKFIKAIRQSQPCLLEKMKVENCQHAWQSGFKKILKDLEITRIPRPSFLTRKKRIAVILSEAYRGGTLRGALLLAKAIHIGSMQSQSDAEVIFGHLDRPDIYTEEDFSDLDNSIKVREYQWRTLKSDESFQAMNFNGFNPEFIAGSYQVPEDGINQFMDCDLWVLVSDRLKYPILPLRPYILMQYDYLQRNIVEISKSLNVIEKSLFKVAHDAQRVFVTTHFTCKQAINFVGIPESKVRVLPMLAPEFSMQRKNEQTQLKHRYFLWTTNLARHKNHLNALKALKIYYEEFGGSLLCMVTGVETEKLLDVGRSHSEPLRKILSSSIALQNKLKILGELSDQDYKNKLACSEFLWHPAKLDNGTFSVIEAAHLAVPSLSADYPAMQEINKQFGLNLSWMDPQDPLNMAEQLHRISSKIDAGYIYSPDKDKLNEQTVSHLASFYWREIQECL